MLNKWLSLLTILSSLYILPNKTFATGMSSCTVVVNGQQQISYFSNTDNKAKKRCKSPIRLLKGKANTSKSNKKNTITTTIRAIRDRSKTNKKCSAYGGTVKINGKTFHLDSNLLCKRYGINHKGSASIQKGRTHAVNKLYQKKISSYINQTAQQHGLEPAFIHAIISAESAYNPNAKSRAGAMGLMQLMPFTAKRFGVTNPYHPQQNIKGGIRYLKILLKEFGSLHLAAAGYNAGEGAVRKYGNSIPPYTETQAYVPKVMAFYNKYKKNPKLISLQ